MNCTNSCPGIEETYDTSSRINYMSIGLPQISWGASTPDTNKLYCCLSTLSAPPTPTSINV